MPDTMRPSSQMAHGQGDVREKPHTANVGNETKADMKGAMLGQPTDKNPLRGALQELGAQHPIKYDDRGPHQGKDHHVRHVPMRMK